ncbi:MAG TPA: ectoine/hydroxyectoine ABC transporter substrate-binding protein EhuB [Euzebya sp.]|nr:ectoine/hydroxyectoine ABC transporter substrate-binding protein EhuB [Euzebya sp.]
MMALAAGLLLLAAACGDGDADDVEAAVDDIADAADDAADGDDAPAGDGVLGELQESGSIRIGIANEVPYGYEDEDGNVTGEAPEVARVVLEELGITDVEAVIVDFGALIPGLQADRFDMIAAGMFINAERAQEIIFSDPDYCVSNSFAVAEGNPMEISDFQSIIDSGATVAVLSGAVDEGYAVDSGVPDDQIDRYADVNAQYDALAAGRVDAVSGTSLTVNTQTETREGMDATESFFPVIDGVEQIGCGGFGFADQEFRDAFNDVLKERQADGTVAEIVTGFGFSDADVETAAGLTVADLTGE